jgi:hypothetical protein
MKHIGFTGTQQGMSKAQKTVLRIVLEHQFEPTTYFHHGDCVGADAEAHKIAREIGYLIHLHPPENPSKRAFCDCDREEEPLPYLERNHKIVDCTDWLLASPKEDEEVLRSGTWATIRYARKNKKQVEIVYP